ncbi:hypothetical protein CPB85DRAFT_1560740 [Mucidula mucida]|nr:hypothetical protein CPB85DRAFT_1560740 [Mucidula mucida]
MATNTNKKLKRANPATIQDKFLVGYQGWFTCAGDGEPVYPGHHGWLHWFNEPIPCGGRPNTDLWPEVSSYDSDELFDAPGLPGAQLFSSRHPKTVQRHFHWMAEHGVDGVFLQRFAGQCDTAPGGESEGGRGMIRIRDEVGDLVRAASEEEDRVWAIMYDVSGVPPDRIQRILEQDWHHLLHDRRILTSPSYLHERGSPVLALWGFGMSDAHHTPGLVTAIMRSLRAMTPGGLYIYAGTPSNWRTLDGDMSRDEAWSDVWLGEVDAISPWTIGRYNGERERFNEQQGRRVDYMPVVLPGGSGYNLSEGKWGFNDIKRNGGRFLWKQVFHAKRLGVRTIYGAMWDEYDEGTAFMPVVSKKRNLPRSDKWRFMALDEDGYDLPPDWYMRICGFAAEGLRSERMIHESFPSKELDDYWATRPKYEEEIVSPSASGSGNGGGGGYDEWVKTQPTTDGDEPPPPPYSLEAEETPAESPPASAPVVSTTTFVTAPAPTVSTTAPISASSSTTTVDVPTPTSDVRHPSTASVAGALNRPHQPSSPGFLGAGPASVGLDGRQSPGSSLAGRHSPGSPSFLGAGPSTVGGSGSQPSSPGFMGSQPSSPGFMGPRVASPGVMGSQPSSPGFAGYGNPNRIDAVDSMADDFARQNLARTSSVASGYGQPPSSLPYAAPAISGYTAPAPGASSYMPPEASGHNPSFRPTYTPPSASPYPPVNSSSYGPTSLYENSSFTPSGPPSVPSGTRPISPPTGSGRIGITPPPVHPASSMHSSGYTTGAHPPPPVHPAMAKRPSTASLPGGRPGSAGGGSGRLGSVPGGPPPPLPNSHRPSTANSMRPPPLPGHHPPSNLPHHPSYDAPYGPPRPGSSSPYEISRPGSSSPYEPGVNAPYEPPRPPSSSPQWPPSEWGQPPNTAQYATYSRPQNMSPSPNPHMMPLPSSPGMPQPGAGGYPQEPFGGSTYAPQPPFGGGPPQMYGSGGYDAPYAPPTPQPYGGGGGYYPSYGPGGGEERASRGRSIPHSLSRLIPTLRIIRERLCVSWAGFAASPTTRGSGGWWFCEFAVYGDGDECVGECGG